MTSLPLQSLVICSSAADEEIGATIRRYLEANCPFLGVQDDVIVPSPEELLETVDRALSSDLTLLLLSPEANPGLLARVQWEPVLLEQPRELGSTLAFALARPCRFPQLLRKQKFFDLSTEAYSGLRSLRRWLIEQNPFKRERVEFLPPRPAAPESDSDVIADLERRIGDQPGMAWDVARDTALAFAHSHSRDFEGVFWINCSGRNEAGIVGDTAHALGLKLAGPKAENRAALHEFCAGRRCLFVFDGLPTGDRELVSFRGHGSVLFTTPATAQADCLPLAETVALFSRWRTNPEPALEHLRDASLHLQFLSSASAPEAASLVKNLGADMFGLLQQRERLAEALEVLDVLSKHAWNEGSEAELRRWEWEKGWIREAWGQTPSARVRLGAPAQAAQLSLAF